MLRKPCTLRVLSGTLKSCSSDQGILRHFSTDTASKRQAQACKLDYIMLHATCMLLPGEDLGPINTQSSIAVIHRMLAAHFTYFEGMEG
jgi:hypothetical protein